MPVEPRPVFPVAEEFSLPQCSPDVCSSLDLQGAVEMNAIASILEQSHQWKFSDNLSLFSLFKVL